MVREILLLGNPKLYEICEEVKREELKSLEPVVADLHDTLLDFRKRYGAGRAIAAPQIGAGKRLVYMFIDKPVVFINPKLSLGSETMEVIDDCMSFPGLFVRVKRSKRLTVSYKDMNFKSCEAVYEDGLAELLQHECDHLDGILATMRAIDNKSFVLKGGSDEKVL